MYWNPKRTLSYNAIYNLIVGNRGGGKTVGALTYCIKRWLKNNKWEWGYTRRYNTEMDKVKENDKLFKDLIELGESGNPDFQFAREHEFTCDGETLRCDGNVMGYSFTLSDQAMYKGNPYPRVRVNIFEEFLIDKGFRRYLPNEVETFLELDQTIDRDRDQLRWLMLANLISENNPYFTYWNLNTPYQSTRKLYGNDNQVLVELVQDEELIAKKKATRRGQLMDGTRYGNYAIENVSLRDTNEFLSKKTATCEYRFTLLYYDQKIGIWYDVRNGIFYVSPDVDKQCPLQFAATTEDQKPNIMLLKGAKKSPFVARLMDAYNKGCVYYETQKVKAWFRDIARMAL